MCLGKSGHGYKTKCQQIMAILSKQTKHLSYYLDILHSYFVAKCNDPGIIQNGTKTGSAPYHQGYSVTYQCADGYTMKGNNTLTCQSNSDWDNTPPTCSAQGRFKMIVF